MKKFRTETDKGKTTLIQDRCAVDLEREITNWLQHGHITDTRFDNYTDEDIEETAKHFFELGLKAQKGR